MTETSVPLPDESGAPGVGDIGTWYDRLALLYDEVSGPNIHDGYWDSPEDCTPFAEAQDRLTDEVIARLKVSPGDRVLDAGCGMGAPAIRLARTADVRVVGVSVSEVQVQRATAAAVGEGLADRVRFECGDVHHLAYPDEYFDVACAIESMPHMDRPRAFAELRRVLKPGGRLVVTDWFVSGPCSEADRELCERFSLLSRLNTFLAADQYFTAVRGAGLSLLEFLDIDENTRRTFQCWRDNFHRSRDALLKEYGPDLCDAYDAFMADYMNGSEPHYLIVTARRPAAPVRQPTAEERFWNALPLPRPPHRNAPGDGQRSLAFFRSCGLLRGKDSQRWFLALGANELMARVYPDSHGPDLDLAVDVFLWSVLFDDLFDVRRAPQAEDLAALLAQLAAVLEETPVADAHSLARALASVWERARAGMSPAWRRRAAHHWREWIEVVATEADNRRSSTHLGLDGYLAQRRISMPTLLFSDLIERLGGFELSDGTLKHPQVTALLTAVQDANVLLNDLGSEGKEATDGDRHNIIPVLCRTRGANPEQARQWARQMATERVDDVTRARTALAQAAVPAHSDTDLTAWADLLVGFIAANVYLLRHTRRYIDQGVPAASRHAHVENLLPRPEEGS